MGTLPYTSQVDARTLNVNTPRRVNAFGAESFGMSAARGIDDAARALGDTGDVLREERQRKEKEQTLYNVATADFSPIENELQKTMSPDGEGYKDAVKTAYTNWVETTTGDIEDDNVRQATKEQLLSKLPAQVGKADTVQQAATLATSKDRTNAVLSAQQNRVLSDPSAYDDALAMSREAVDLYAGNIPAPLREGMKVQSDYDVTKKRFEGMLNKAKSPTELDAAQKEMESDEWQSKLMARDYEDLSNKIDSAKKVYENQIKSEVTTKLKELEARSTDPTVIIPQDELVEVQKQAAQSGDSASQVRVARIIRNQAIMRSDGRLTMPQLKQRMEDLKAKPDSGLQSEALHNVGEVAVKYGVSASYLAQGVDRESQGVATAKNPDSTATGLGQFLESTWMGLVKDPAVANALGVTEDMSKTAILALRNDPKASIEAMAILAKQNKAYMEPRLGHQLDDTELYLGHFLGNVEAVKFIQAAQNNPNALAKDMFPEQAAVNKNVFYDKATGEPRTLASMYSKISESFGSVVTNVAADDIKVYQAMYDKQDKALAGSGAMEYAAGVGVVPAVDLAQDGGFALLGKNHRIASSYFKKELQPFTAEQESAIQQKLQTGTATDALGILSGIQTMGPDSAKAAFTQLKVKAPAFAVAGKLLLDGDAASAADVVRGQKRLQENPAMLTGLGYSEDKATVAFEKAVGSSLSMIDPSERQAVQEAARSMLAETKGATGAAYKDADYTESVNRVLGNRLDKVNGFPVYTPQGVTGDMIERALQGATTQDYIAASIDGTAPVYKDGTAVNPLDLADDAQLRARGDDTYYILDSDGSYLSNGKKDANGLPMPFIIKLDAARVKGIAERPLTFAQQQALTTASVGRARGLAMATGGL